MHFYTYISHCSPQPEGLWSSEVWKGVTSPPQSEISMTCSACRIPGFGSNWLSNSGGNKLNGIYKSFGQCKSILEVFFNVLWHKSIWETW